MATSDPVGTVQRLFAAFRAGDLDGVLATVDADTRWTYVGANPKPTKGELIGSLESDVSLKGFSDASR